MQLIELPYLYKCHGKPPRHKNDQDFYVFGKNVFEFRVIEPEEVEPVFIHKHFGEDKTHDSLFYKVDDMVVRDFSETLWSGFKAPVKPETFNELAESQRRTPNELMVSSNSFQYGYGRNFQEDEIRNWKNVQASFKDEAFAELQKKISEEFVFVRQGDDLVLQQKQHPPAWRIHLGSDQALAHAYFNPAGESRYTFFLPGEMKPQLSEFGDWYTSETGKPFSVNQESDIETVSAPIPTPEILIGNISVLINFAELNYVGQMPFGEEVQTLGERFKAERTIANGLAFVLAFEEAATKPNAYALPGSRNAHEYCGAFWKIYEMLPAAYKIDVVNGNAEDSAFDEELSAFGM